MVGGANGHYRSGRYSKYLPPRMAAKYQEALRDPDFLSLKDELAAIDARLADLFARVDTGESGEIWQTLHKEWAQFLLMRTLGDIPKMHVSVAKLDALFARQLIDSAAWAEIAEKIEARRRLVDTEQKRLVTSQQVLNQTEAMVYMGAITDVITRNVTDKQVLSQMLVELQQIMVRDQIPVYAELPA